mmetsp:Transcript_31573/g.100190  ORF Transcript_31573/g.100190 Transcript_31573/m.100190 type:complete len:127 (-) Transcript_31573:1576-1956(-)
MMLVTPLALALALALPAPAPALAPLRATTGAARAATRTRLAAQIVSQNDRTDVELKQGIGKFYDESSGLWLETWGEHMHHGYYEVGAKPRPGHREAQVRRGPNERRSKPEPAPEPEPDPEPPVAIA